MALFTRAYDAALRTANLSRAQAAISAGLDASILSRILNNERPAQSDHVAALLRAIPNQSDREHCLTCFLRDQCPEEYRDQLILHFGELREPRANSGDGLSRVMARLDELADGDTDLRRLLTNLVALLDNKQ